MAVNSILFRSFPLSDWPWGGASGNLCIFDDLQWTDQNGLVRLSNITQEIGEPLQRCPIIVTDHQAVVQDFYYQPTTLSIERPRVRRTGVIFDENDNLHYELFRGCVFPVNPDPMTWIEFVRYNVRARGRARMQDRYLDADAIYALFTNLHFVTAEDLARLPTARGSAQMIVDVAAGASQVIVPCVLVTEDSVIKPYSQSAGVSASLSVPERTVGQDFTIRSSVLGDEGLVAWEVSEPF